MPREHVFVRFGKALKKVRSLRGLSQEKLAEMAGLHRTYVSTVERGQRNISILNIEKLAVALEVPMSKLMPE
jgi:transcriptional regulator with XRE-family HTH domain